jgi:hypothetical protein
LAFLLAEAVEIGEKLFHWIEPMRSDAMDNTKW